MITPNLFNIKNTLKRKPLNKTNITTIRTIELFAGVGGFRIGLENARSKKKAFDIVWSNQYEPSTKTQHASDIYIQRFGSENHSNKDIALVDVDTIPEHDLLVGGFPCQDYSIATTLKNSLGIIGKKGVLWWEIYRILFQKKEKAPNYLLLENVDRLLKSPASQRGRDFAIILSSLNSLGYAIEWRVINASEYGMPQRRRRVFILAYKKGTKLYNKLSSFCTNELIGRELLLSKTFPIKPIDNKTLISRELHSDLVEITENFNKESPKKNAFWESGYMIDGKYYTSRVEVDYEGSYSVLGDFLIDERDVPKEFYIDDEELKKWQYQKGAKSIPRVNKKTGHEYIYSEGSMGFPDALDKPSRTIITGEGGASASRFKHVIEVNGRHRRLTPIELERLNMFPDNHTEGVTDSKRAFLMGNALVVGIVERIGKQLLKEIDEN